jgi:Flp pilus assembly protein TadG
MTTRGRRGISLVTRRGDEQGQLLVVFALSLVVLLAFGGLALDGGSAFAQRRSEQTAADLAALAGANDYLVNGSQAAAIARAVSVAETNGYDASIDGTSVGVSVDTSNGIRVTVSLGALHHNLVVGVVGMPTWPVSVEATALAGFPDTAYAASPFIFAASAFATDGTPLYQTPTDFGDGNGAVPNGQLDFAWTDYGDCVSTSDVSKIIAGTKVINKTVQFGEYIGQCNSGYHTALFDEVQTHLAGKDVPAAVVDPSGHFVGWSIFHVISADGTSSKSVRGYFVSSFESAQLAITSCAANNCPRYMGAYVLKLSQ